MSDFDKQLLATLALGDLLTWVLMNRDNLTTAETRNSTRDKKALFFALYDVEPSGELWIKARWPRLP